MTFSSCLSDLDSHLVLDASVVINILATGHSVSILDALQRSFLLPEAVFREVHEGGRSDHRQLTALNDLVHRQLIEVVPLQGDVLGTFFSLVTGPAVESLGDGEAATIALAHARHACAVVDEKKATNICGGRYPELRVATTLDVLAHDSVEASIGRDALANAILEALMRARMQVRAHQFDWVSSLIGPIGVSECSSLRRLARARERAQPAIRAVG